MTHEKRHSQTDNRWYTDPQYPDLARRVMGTIELDPASDSEANKYIGADRIFTAEDNGLLQPWICKTLWLNAPGKIKKAPKSVNQYLGQTLWQNKLIAEYKAGRVKEAIMLIFNASAVEADRIQSLKGVYAYCEVTGRINFIPPAGKYPPGTKGSNTQPSAFVYFGADPSLFYEVFSDIGVITMIGGVYRKQYSLFDLPLFAGLNLQAVRS